MKCKVCGRKLFVNIDPRTPRAPRIGDDVWCINPSCEAWGVVMRIADARN